MTINFGRSCPIKACNVRICIFASKLSKTTPIPVENAKWSNFPQWEDDAFQSPPFCYLATFDRQECLDKTICRHFDK